MTRIKEWINELGAVLESSPDLEYAIASAFSLPCLIFALGTWLVTSLDTPWPYGSMMVAVEEPLEMLFAVVAAITFIRLMDAVVERYRQVRARMDGHLT